MWNLKYDDTNGLVYKTERDSQTEIKFIVIKRERQGTDELRIQDQKIKTTTYKTDKQQGPAVQHKDVYLISFNNLSFKSIYACVRV